MAYSSLSLYARHILEKREKGILIAVEEVKGSTPRDVDARMLVTSTITYGTIGGGHLEWDAIRKAQAIMGKEGEWVNAASATAQIGVHKIVLGKDNTQCCGGSVTLGFYLLDEKCVKVLEHEEERAMTLMPTILVFGMGHVGQAVVAALGLLPVRVKWFDLITDKLPKDFSIPANCEVIITSRQEEYIHSYGHHTAILVMTHSHILDSLLIEKALTTPELDYIGMIGSEHKRKRFIEAFLKNGIQQERLNRLVCPIGNKTSDKRPAIIAAQIAAALSNLFFS